MTFPDRALDGSRPLTDDEPSFTRVPRPSSTQTAYASAVTNPASHNWNHDPSVSRGVDRRRRMAFGIGFSWFTVMCGGLGAWAFMRWRRQRNRPINRLRRQARQTANEIRERVPNRDEAARPAMGLSTALLSLGLVLWQLTRSRTADKAVSDLDWQKRLMKLKERWTPGRVELEKISISRH